MKNNRFKEGYVPRIKKPDLFLKLHPHFGIKSTEEIIEG